MSKHREFWIATVPHEYDIESMVCIAGPYGEGYDNLHVIEKSAYDTLKADYDELKAQGDAQTNLDLSIKVSHLIHEKEQLKTQILDLQMDRDRFKKKHADQKEQADELEKELLEQARLNGMGGERELRLMAELELWKKTNAGLVEACDKYKAELEQLKSEVEWYQNHHMTPFIQINENLVDQLKELQRLANKYLVMLATCADIIDEACYNDSYACQPLPEEIRAALKENTSSSVLGPDEGS